MLYTYSFANKKRDLTDVLSTIVQGSPRFISFFPMVAEATQRKHEWLEDTIGGRSFKPSAVSGNELTIDGADLGKVAVGTQIVIDGDSALFEITAISGGVATVKLLAGNGSATAAPVADKVYKVVSTPIIEGSTKGEETSHQSGVNYNTTQIFRKEINITGSALAIGVYGNVDNAVNRQTQFALTELAYDLNRAALFGIRQEVAPGKNGSLGGLYSFGTQEGGLAVDAAGATLDSSVINDAAQAILDAGGMASIILCNPGQARVISNEYKDKVQVVRGDQARGVFVASVVNEINGNLMTIVSDPDIPNTDVWLIDPAGFGMSNLRGRGITDRDTTAANFDGIQRTAIGELTLEFKNAKQRLCRIKGLKDSAAALAALRG